MGSKKLLVTIIFVLILTFSLLACEGLGEITINGFSVDYSNVDMDLEIGEDVDLSKLVVTATKSDGTTITLKEGEDFTIDLGDFDKTTPGEYTIKVKYKDFPEKTFVVEVKEVADSAVLTGIAVATDSTHKTVFAYDEAFSSANLVLTATYDDETTARITEGFTLNSSEYNKAHGQASEQSYTITVTYNSKITTYSVSVAADPSKIIKGISAKGDYKTSYNYYEDFSSAGLELQVTMMDDSTTTLTSGFELDSTGYNKLHGFGEAQTYDISLSYMGKTTSYEVTVARAKVVGVYIVDNNKVAFKYGEEFAMGSAKFYARYENSLYTEELTVSQEYGNGKCIIDSSDYNREHENIDTQWYSIYVRYSDEVFEDYAVTVAPVPYFQGYRVGAGSTHQTEFGKEEAFTYEGLIVEAVYGSEENGDLYIKSFTEGYTISPTFQDTTPDTYGFYQIYVSIENIGSGNSYPLYYISVTDENEEENIIEISASLGRIEYYQNTELDLTGSSLHVNLEGGSSYTIFLPNSLVEVTGFDASSIGDDKVLNFAYKGKTCPATYNVVEDQLDYIDVVDDDTFRTDYYFGEELSYQGITVYDVYLSGRREVKLDYDKQSNYNAFEANSYEVVIAGISYYVQVYSFLPATAPESITLYDIDTNSFDAEEGVNGRWQVEVGGAGEYLLEAYLGNDFISDYDVMLGEYAHGGVFLPLPSIKGNYLINYSGTDDLTVTIRINNANGNVSYSYLTIKSEKVYFSDITINGEEIVLSVSNEYRYYINNVANSYVFDWTIDSKYTVIGIVKGSTVTLNSYDYSRYLEITVKEGNETLVTYDVVIVPYVLVSAISIGEMEATKETYYSETKFVANITNIYGASSYAVNITVPQNFTATLKFGGMSINSIDSGMLFVGNNLFTIEVYDINNNSVMEYDLDITIDNPSFMPQYALMRIGESQVAANLSYYYGDHTQGHFVYFDGLAPEQSYSLTFYWNGEMPLNTVVTLADKQLWTNGGDISLDSGRNQLVVKVSDGIKTYQAYVILYAEYNLPLNEPWQRVDLYVAGVKAENNNNLLPQAYDIYFITIPNGFDFYTDITNNVELIPYNDNDISMYTFTYEVNSQHDRIRVTVRQEGDLVGYLYVIVIYEGEVNDDTTLLVYNMTPVEAMMGELINEVEFAPNAENGNRMEASTTATNGNYIVFVFPYFASCTAEPNEPGAIMFVENYVCMITYEGTESFEITFRVTSSDKTADAYYYLIVNIEEAEDVLSFSFGGEGYLELGYTLNELFGLASEYDGWIYFDIPTLQINPSDFDTVNNTVTFVLTSIYTCVEEDTTTVIGNGVAHTFDIVPDDENNPVYYSLDFYLCLEGAYSPDSSTLITLYFHLPVIKMTFSDDTSLAQYREIGDFLLDETEGFFYIEMTQEEYENKLDGDSKFLVDLTFYYPVFVCYYDGEDYLSQVNDLEIVFNEGTGVLTVCMPALGDGEDNFMDIFIYVIDAGR